MKYFLILLISFLHLSLFAQERVRLRVGVDGAIGFGESVLKNPETIGNGVATATIGLSKNGFMLSGGGGIFKMRGTPSNDHYIATFGELSYMVQHNPVAPFFSLKVGKLKPRKDEPTLFPALDKPTMMYNPSVGLALDVKILYVIPFLEYFVPADFNSRYDTFGAGLRILTK